MAATTDGGGVDDDGDSVVSSGAGISGRLSAASSHVSGASSIKLEGMTVDASSTDMSILLEAGGGDGKVSAAKTASVATTNSSGGTSEDLEEVRFLFCLNSEI